MGTEKMLFRLEQPHGPGDIYIAWQNGSGNFLATTGVDAIVNIYDRYGNTQETIRLPSLCAGFAWDADGDVLGVISQTPQLILWDANTKKKQTVDVGLKDGLTCILWAKALPLLAVGTNKGNVSIYNHATSKRIPIIAKHTKKITCGCWNKENLLALGSEDKTISISNIEGDTLRVIALRAEPSDVQFSEMKLDERMGGENTVSMIVGKRTLYLYNLTDPENPIELAFQQHYGAMVTYKWYGDGYILLGFAGGYFIAISTHIKEVGQELFQVRNHKINLTDIALCTAVGKVASSGDNVVKIHDIANLQETLSVLTLNQEIGLDRVAWSNDGQLLGVCTRNGSVVVYVANMPTLMAVCGPRIAIQSNLVEISLYTYTPDKGKLQPIPISLEIEPQVIAVGTYHFASAMNNRIWFYDLNAIDRNGFDGSNRLVNVRQYLGHIESVRLSAEYVSVLYDGKIQLHMIEAAEADNEDKESIIFPDLNNLHDVTITSHALTNEFLVYSTDGGQIVYFCLEEWSPANQYKHPVGIQSIYLDPAGSRLLFIDVKAQGFLYNAVNNETITIPELPNKISGVTWDSNLADRNCFIIFDETEIATYLYVPFSVYGSSVQRIGVTTLASKQTPLLMFAGEVMSATAGGQLTHLTLATHDVMQLSSTEKDRVLLENNFNKQLDLHRFHTAWSTALYLGTKELWRKLARKAIVNLDLELGVRVYRKLDDVAMVQSLEELCDVEDQRMLAGCVAMYLGDYDQAQIWFLKSSVPTLALDMRRDLLQWDQALLLAKKMAPEQIPYISKEYAQQLEFTGNYSEAFVHYEKGIQEAASAEHLLTCKAGLARTSIRVGNFKQGIAIAQEVDSKSLYRECAEILDGKKQLADAAMMYERGGQHERAASGYIKLRNWPKVGEMLPHVTSHKIHVQYAKAKENEGKYQEAADAYYNAKDFDSVIRLQLDYLNNPEVAVELAQETKSVEGAKLIARFFQRLNDFPTAIRFLVLSKCHDEAFELARKHAKLQLYGEILLNSLDPDDIKPEYFNSLALYFEQERNYLYAGKYWFHAKEYQKAMKLLLRVAKSNSEENEALSAAIDVVASSNDEQLAQQLIEYLLGEVDGVPKDPKYLFRLYMARKQFREASKSAIIIASEEQINGNYRNAHDVLFGMYQELKHNGIKVPHEMHASLMLLHSYILVRLHVKHSDHMKGARMLIRVANNISKFPSHIVPILTSAVIECHRAGLRQAAHKYASLLMKPEYRKKIDAKYAKKIEAVVRKPPKMGKDGEAVEDPPEEYTPCPYCNNDLLETSVNCNVCKNHIPFCIVTGRHIVATDLTACPECDFPAILSEFVKILETEDVCPMCTEKIDGRRLQKITDFKSYLNFE